MNSYGKQGIGGAQGGGGTRPNRTQAPTQGVEHKGTIGTGQSNMATKGAMTGAGSCECKGTI